MKELLSTVTSKGQVTIPAEIRRMLRVSPHDKVAFVVEKDQVRLARRGSVVAHTAGILKSEGQALSAEELREAAEKAIAEDVLERMGG